MSDEKTALIVDRANFSALIARMLQGRFQTETAGDGVQAIKKLRLQTPNVVVVDQDIPGNGIRFAELLGMNPKYQNLAIILTSASPSPESIIRARNAGISAFLAKPFKPSELTSRIDFSLTKPNPDGAKPKPVSSKENGEEKDGEAKDPKAKGGENDDDDEEGSDIANRVRQIEGLPPFPATHTQILELAKSDEASSDDLAEKIQLDPSMVATVLKLANSSYYGFSKKTDSLQMAVTRLGMEEIANLVLAAQVFEKLGGFEEGKGLDMKAFWKHSVGTGFAARSVAKKLQTEVESAFLGGMLHDLGKIVLDRFFADYYLAVIELVKDEEMSLYKAEQETMGLTHAEVGGQLAEEWKFPKNYLNCILYHHNPRAAKRYQRLVCVVHLADVLCRELKFGSGGDEQTPKIDESVLDRFSLGDKGMEILREAVEEDLDGANSFLSGLSG